MRGHQSQGADELVVLDSAADTEALGAALAAELGPGAVVHLRGELGAGKTTLAQAVCRALGVEEPVTSPTFTVANSYRGAGGLQISHLDLYRSRGVTVEELADLEPYLAEDALILIEWPEAGEGMLPAPTLAVELEHADGGRRARIRRGTAG